MVKRVRLVRLVDWSCVFVANYSETLLTVKGLCFLCCNALFCQKVVARLELGFWRIKAKIIKKKKYEAGQAD